MELLEFARGPALTFAITVFIAGIVFRIVSLFALWRTKDSSAGSPREKSAFSAALREVIRSGVGSRTLQAHRIAPARPRHRKSVKMTLHGYNSS